MDIKVNSAEDAMDWTDLLAGIGFRGELNFLMEENTSETTSTQGDSFIESGFIDNEMITANLIEPEQGHIVVLSMEGEELRRVSIPGEDRYVRVDKAAFNSASSRFAKNNMEYNTMLSIWALRNRESTTGITNLISEQTDIGLSITGAMRQGNNLIGDVSVNFEVIFDDGGSYIVDSYSGVAGGFGNGAPENGSYTVGNYQDRSPSGWYNKGMNRDGVGFSYNLDPQFNTGRSLLRIHPDGNNEGTLGCIGLSGNGRELNAFKDALNEYLEDRNSIRVNINISNNPNNNGRSGKKIPNVNE
ncbi:hypothetical protein [Sinomicrobium sp.]